MAKTNYQQLRKQKEAARKHRRQDKLDRRTQKGAEGEQVTAPETSPVTEPAPSNGGVVE